MAKLIFLSLSPLLFLILLSLPFQSKSQSQPQTSQQQLQLLLKIKSDWQDPLSLSNWTSSNGNHCYWPEINCTVDGTITEIILRNKNLPFPIPSSICDLTNLTKIDLYWNNIPGPFPIYLSSCTNLQYLDISKNYFVGRLPSDIDRLSSLQYFYLNGNNFTGDIPPEIGRMSNLIDLELNQNLFNGSVPSEIGNLANLKTLDLSYLSIMPGWRIPPEFGQLTKLKNLWIRNSNLTGEIPGSLTNLTDLVMLDLATNKLSGDIPRDLFRLKNLKVVYLFYNSLSGEIPTPVDALGLEDVDLSMNQLTGTIPEDLGQLQNLQYLSLYFNRISGEIPAGLGRLPRLIDVRLFNNSLTGSLPPELGLHTNLEKIEVANNRLSGTLPEYLCHGGVLRGLVVFSNNMSGSVPESLGNCNSLTTAQLDRNGFSGDIPVGLWSAENLTSIMIYDNQFTGPLPEKLGPNLSRLDISNNKFSGPIPAIISYSETLMVFKASNNQFSGVFPKSLTELTQLQTLELDGNRISGELPPGIISWRALNVLNLRKNQLTGRIPAAIGLLSRLNSLDLSGNQLSGEIPPELGNLKLSQLDLSSNQLSGKIPDGLDNPGFDNSFLYNPGLCASKNPFSYLRSCASQSRESSKISPRVLASILAIAGFVTLVLAFLAWFVLRDYIISPTAKTNNQNAEIGSSPYENRQFKYAEVISITNNFERSIGKGGFGTVYHGQMTHGTQVAVKMLSLQSIKSPCQGSKEFQNEVHLLMRVHHRNLVPFIGYCQEDGNMALIYEYMPQGHLGSHLSDSNANPLIWDRRLRIALDVAQGLEYLHNNCKPPIIHRDVKTANILLNERLEAKIGDFGLSKVFSDEFTHVSTAVKGTFGYLDPEYCNSNNLTEKSDVYSFGVVLLQLITGKSAIVQISVSERRSLIDWAISMVVRGDTRDVIDPKLEGNYDINSILKVIEIARACTKQKSVERPTMKDVVVELKECLGNEKALESAPESGVCMHSGPVQTTSEILSYLSAR
ncbi:putative LRR receptor-like serine/threonine-protein kinase [Cinnamomum micranthum f. kanehirae]|uniref:Putative LRR receptor-like serine/threonine-protein kinase n=1 Tax=Cinnamomum micranthum f. kanehirae TaxID=337451 RepID=A0A443NI60_9MAGN|nr:putative LRR receptor-like serine/threonine-protein kinase [Cinnamomum micranthum f. kanehirae]